ncbi:MAG: hypothetical protein LUB58_00015 [Oscillospiraceae bacterium]|nr:hypothetical protein [Oscillospiraceae bacterium]
MEMSQGNIAQSERWRPVKIFVIIALQELEIPKGFLRFSRVLLTQKFLCEPSLSNAAMLPEFFARGLDKANSNQEGEIA